MIEEKKVSEAMTRGIISVSEGMDLKEAAEVLTDHNISGAIVVDSFNKPVGVISGIDIAKTLVEGKKDLKMKDIMSRTIYTVDPETSLKDAAKIINKNRVHRLFVYPGDQGFKEINGVPLGIITTGDIIRELSRLA
jgi:predicted transcriptional regulator